MKHTWHRWLLTGSLVALMLAAAVVPALAQESTSRTTNQPTGLTLGMLLFGIACILFLGFASYIRDNMNGDN